LKHWLRDGLRPLMEDLLSPTRLGQGDLFKADEIDRLKREHLEARANHSHLLWSLMVFEMWRRRWSV
ncbi:MAG: asparagine synthase-related protein, partial [Candidatus Rokuibacteriota bacterium]